MYNKTLKFLIIALNLFSSYVILFGGFYYYLERIQFSFIPHEVRQFVSLLISVLAIVVLIYSIYKLTRSSKIYLPYHLLISIVPIVFIIYVRYTYPDSETAYVENGYEIQIRKWNRKSYRICKKWKSAEPLSTEDDYSKIRFILDTAYIEYYKTTVPNKK